MPTEISRSEGDTVPFAVQNNTSESKRSDGVFRLKDFAAVSSHGRNRFIQSSVDIEIDHHTLP